MTILEESEQIKLAKFEFARLIEVCHRQGINYWQLLDILLRDCVQLHREASAEYQAKGGI